VVQSPFVAPTFPDKIVALFGQPLHISCYALGIPEPTSKWILTGDKPSDDFLKNSFSRQLENVPDNVKPVDLNVESLSIKTTGFYQCVTENEHGKSELGVWVVGAQPTEPGPEFQNEAIISARAGDSVELGCEVIVDPVLTNVAPVRRFWEKDGKILVRLFRTTNLIFRKKLIKFMFRIPISAFHVLFHLGFFTSLKDHGTMCGTYS
jgi:hypothetical protein